MTDDVGELGTGAAQHPLDVVEGELGLRLHVTGNELHVLTQGDLARHVDQRPAPLTETPSLYFANSAGYRSICSLMGAPR